MARQSKQHGPVRIVFRRSSMLLKCVVITAVILSTITLCTVAAVSQQMQEQAEAYRQQAALLEQSNQKLSLYISQLGTVQGVKHIANEKLGLVDPNEIFFKPVDHTNP